MVNYLHSAIISDEYTTSRWNSQLVTILDAYNWLTKCLLLMHAHASAAGVLLKAEVGEGEYLLEDT